MNKMSGSMESITMAITDEPMDWMTCLMTQDGVHEYGTTSRYSEMSTTEMMETKTTPHVVMVRAIA